MTNAFEKRFNQAVEHALAKRTPAEQRRVEKLWRRKKLDAQVRNPFILTRLISRLILTQL